MERTRDDTMKSLILGNEAIARGAYEAGVKVAAAYPGTPSTEITEAIIEYEGIYAEWSPNEKVALEVGLGASIAGARSIVSMKHVGLNVAADPLFTGAYTGVNGGLVIVVADDPGMHSSQNEQDSRFYARSAHVPMLEPSDSQEAKDFTRFAFELSEQYDTPVLLRMTTRIAHSQSIVTFDEPLPIVLKEYKRDPQKYVMMPAMARKRHVFVEERMNALKKAASRLDINRIEWNDSSMGIITSGAAYQYVKEALPNASVLKLGMVYPLPEDMIREFAAKVENLYVVEELEPFFEDQIKAWGLKVIGKELFSVLGELDSSIIRSKLGTVGEEGIEEHTGSMPVRPPVMCPGCPHRAMYYVINKLKLVVTGDIGCYTLGALPPLQALDTCICMGASLGNALGMEKARGKEFAKKLVAVIGDSTFMHSGITGLIDIVYNQGISTVLILDNSTTGMTGHQEHPGTGKNIRLQSAPVIDIEKLVKAIGIEHVRTVDPFDLDRVEKVLKEETNREAPSVIIAQRPCALLTKKKEASYNINEFSCRNCKLCLKLGCPAIENKDTGVSINAALCNGCGLCTEVCKFSSIEKAGEINGK